MLARLEFEGLRAPLSALWRLVRGGGVYWPSSGSCTLTCQDEGLALEFAFIFMAVLTWWVHGYCRGKPGILQSMELQRVGHN